MVKLKKPKISLADEKIAMMDTLSRSISDFELKKIDRDYFVSRFHSIALSLSTVDGKILKEYNDEKEDEIRKSIVKRKKLNV